MRHDEKHAALAAYALWCKLEQTGTDKYQLRHYYKQLFNHMDDHNKCPACVMARRMVERFGMCVFGMDVCDYCPCEWGSLRCDDEDAPYWVWGSELNSGRDARIFAGNIANIMRKWCERVGVIAPREGAE